jgi:tripartite-type tricarboxylate transporter receptor subunit TctC
LAGIEGDIAVGPREEIHDHPHRPTNIVASKRGVRRRFGDRISVAPDIPTIAEAGVPDYEVIGWNGVLAQANTPRPIIDKLNRAIAEALKAPEIEKSLREQGIEPAGNSPEEFALIMHADIEKWKRVTHEASIKPQ